MHFTPCVHFFLEWIKRLGAEQPDGMWSLCLYFWWDGEDACWPHWRPGALSGSVPCCIPHQLSQSHLHIHQVHVGNKNRTCQNFSGKWKVCVFSVVMKLRTFKSCWHQHLYHWLKVKGQKPGDKLLNFLLSFYSNKLAAPPERISSTRWRWRTGRLGGTEKRSSWRTCRTPSHKLCTRASQVG